MSIFGDNFPPAKTITFSLPRLGLSTDSRFYDEHPAAIRQSVDQIARGVLDPDGGHVLVTGFKSVGKSFLIEQFASNVDQYLEKSPYELLNLIEVSRSDSAVVETVSGGIAAYLEACAQAYNCRVENLCLVTESYEFAAALYSYDPKVKVILELNISTFIQLTRREEQGVSKIWSSWEVVDANEAFLKFNDLHSSLNAIVVPKLAQAKLELPEGAVEELLEYFLEQLPDAVYESDEDDDPFDGLILIPPGMWGLAIRKLATLYAYSSSEELRNKEGEISLIKCVEQVFDELEEAFVDLLGMIDRGDEDEEPRMGLPQGLEDTMIQVFQLGGHGPSEANAPEDVPALDPLEFSDLKETEANLKSEIFGQNPAIESICRSFSVPAVGLHDENKPVRSFLFLGPTGVGKTQLALSLAKHVFSEEIPVIRLDMSEYSQPHEASKLLGAPSGYVGYEEGGVLTNAVLKTPRAIILLDEVEKAHHKIWDSFLQILDSGRMTDNKGRVVDFTNTIIILTSNLGSLEVQRGGGLGFFNEVHSSERVRRSVEAEVEKFFKPEFVNRLDELVYFSPLSSDVARKIVRREITIVSDRMAPKGLRLSKFEDDIVDELLRLSSFNKYGARDIQRAVFKNVSEPLALRLLSKTDKRKTLKLSMDINNKIQVK